MESILEIILFTAFGIILVGTGVYLTIRNRYITTYGIKTKATIIRFIKEQKRDSDGNINTYHMPVVRFKDHHTGEPVEKQLTVSQSPKKSHQEIAIIYLKKGNRYEIIMNTTFWKSYFPMIFIGIGVLFIAMGCYWLSKVI